ncbi:Vacuolar assembly/sorting protein [Phytophthora cinnamomi]|uniref:Vacuolar assembly/sorting protein n=1 Tax=Phytophthora cinnamomi TaxID=4785 RepID=UPI00355A8E1B|nr:Vacuolar assembly/sorting protein [Phytophthora cinnamomi]
MSSSADLAPAPAYAPGARVEVDVPPKRPQQTERLLRSLRAPGDHPPLLFTSATDGTLRCYAADARAGALRWQADYKRLAHADAAVLDAWGVLATLADGRLKLLELPLQPQQQQQQRDDTKGAVLFAAHEAAKTLCVLLKGNALRVFDWTVSRALEPRAQHELPTLLPTLLPVQRLLLLSESHALVQGKKDWVVLNLDSGKPLSVADEVVQQVNEALDGGAAVCDAVAVPSRHAARRRQQVLDLLLCGKRRGVILTIDSVEKKGGNPADEEEEDVYGAFEQDESRLGDESAGKALDVSTSQLGVKVDRVIAYDAPPRGVYYHHPFLLLDQGEQIAVYNLGSLQMVQMLPVKMPYGVCAVTDVASATVTDAFNGTQLFRDDLPPTLYTVSPPFDVQAFQMLSIAQQVAASMGNRRLEDAVALCKLCPEESPLCDADQRKLYADYGFELFRSGRRKEAMNFFFESDIDVMEVLLLFPRNLLPRKASALHKENGNNNKDHALAGDDLVESLLALIAFLRRKRNAYVQRDDEPLSMSFRMHRSFGATDESALELIDTMLVKCLVVVAEKATYEERAKRALLEVVTGQNWCEISEAEVFLRAHRHFKALLAFYSARKLHRKALELLEDLERSAASAAALNEKSDSGSKENRSTGDLQTSHDYMVLIAQYLRVLGKKHAELVFEFSRRVVSVNPTLGLSIFTQREVPSSKQDIDPAAILQHLKSCSIAASSGDVKNAEAPEPEGGSEDATKPTLPLTSSQMLSIEYLTQVIYEGSCQLTPRLHDEVVYLLLDSIQAKTPQKQRLTSRVGSQRGMTGLLRRKLLEFLEFPAAAYHPERMLSRTPVEMIDEHAALLSKLGRHREVLQLYALELKDAALAEAYCNRCYESKMADSSIYSTLLSIYLRPQFTTGGGSSGGSASPSIGSPPQPSPLWNRSGRSASLPGLQSAAINVLNKYAERIDVSTALELLPADVAAAPLAGFFRRVLERQVERFRNGQVKKQLSKMENFKVREQLSTKRKGSVTVWSSQCCQSCGKKLGVGTFVRLPNGTLLHYSCQPVP